MQAIKNKMPLTIAEVVKKKTQEFESDLTQLIEKMELDNRREQQILCKKHLRECFEFGEYAKKEIKKIEEKTKQERAELLQRQKKENEDAKRRAEEKMKNIVDQVHLTSGIEDVKSELECPVCLQDMIPPVHIWQCAQGHPVCGECKENPEIRRCPTCRGEIVGRSTFAEKIAASVFT